MKSEDTKYLWKHTAVIHISNDLSAIDRKVYNILLRSAYKRLKEEQMHTISMDDLLQELGHEEYKNYTFIKERIKHLVDTSLRFNILGKDKKKKWESAISLLASVHFVDGLIHYSFPKEISDNFAQPNIYAALNLHHQTKLSSKHSMALWEFCVEQLDSSNQRISKSKMIELEVLKELLGAKSESYQEFKAFNKHVLRKSIDEVNNETDLSISNEIVKQGRQVIGVVFEISKKTGSASKYEPTITNTELNSRSQFIDERVANKAEAMGIAQEALIPVLRDHDTAEVLKGLDTIHDKIKKGHKINNVIGYLMKVLEQGIYKEISSEEISQAINQAQLFKLEKTSNPGGDPVVTGFLRDCRERYGEQIYRHWILHLNYVSYDEEKVVFGVSNNFIRSWIEQHYLDTLLQIWRIQKPQTKEFLLIKM